MAGDDVSVDNPQREYADALAAFKTAEARLKQEMREEERGKLLAMIEAGEPVEVSRIKQVANGRFDERYFTDLLNARGYNRYDIHTDIITINTNG